MKEVIYRLGISNAEGVGYALIAKDKNDEGSDDIAGHAFIWAAGIARSVLDGTPMPKMPEVLRKHVVPVEPEEAAITQPLGDMPSED